jgi:hypothetical protein
MAPRRPQIQGESKTLRFDVSGISKIVFVKRERGTAYVPAVPKVPVVQGIRNTVGTIYVSGMVIIKIPRVRFLLNDLNGALWNMARDSTGRLNVWNGSVPTLRSGYDRVIQMLSRLSR